MCISVYKGDQRREFLALLMGGGGAPRNVDLLLASCNRTEVFVT